MLHSRSEIFCSAEFALGAKMLAPASEQQAELAAVALKQLLGRLMSAPDGVAHVLQVGGTTLFASSF